MCGHLLAHDSNVRFGNRRFVDDFSACHYDDTVGKRQELVEVFTDQEDGHALVAGGENLRMDKIDRCKIQAETGISGDKNLGSSRTEFSCEHGTLDIAAGKSPIGASGPGVLTL